MLNFINKKELISVYSIKEQARIRDILASNGIDYEIKVINRKSPSPLGGGTRATTGTYGENLDIMYQYVIYVNKKDIERAKQVINYNG